MHTVTIATLNLSAPSKDRARRLLDGWILKSSHDVYVFTETSEGDGTDMIISAFDAAGWRVFRRDTLPKDRGVVVASRIDAAHLPDYPNEEPMPGRSLALNFRTTPELQLIGMYVPNRGNDPSKLERKRNFLASWLSHFQNSAHPHVNRLIVGDLNIVPPEQRPIFLPQQPFEDDWFKELLSSAGFYDVALNYYNGHESSWVAHTGEGYTYDHILPDTKLARYVTRFEYDHSTRTSLKVTDHSALILTLSLNDVKYLHRDRITEPRQAELF